MSITGHRELLEVLAKQARAEGLLQPPWAMPSVDKNSPDDSPAGLAWWWT
jgi:hypothetical protein